jgi:hypothetical protein
MICSPQRLERVNQIIRALLEAIVRQMADDERIGRQTPALARTETIAAGAFASLDAEPLQDDVLGPQTEGEGCIAFARRLYENGIRFLQQPAQSGRRVTAARAVVRNVGIAEMQERRDEEWHA